MKIFSLLLFQMASVEWVHKIFDSVPEPSPVAPYYDKPDLRARIRKNIQGGPECYLAFQFVINFLNQIEAVRTDRTEPFIFRLTPDLQHDILVYLHSEARDELATFLILKALYARPGSRAN